jgi:hypothetical protein
MLEGVLVGFLEDDFVGLNVGNIVGFNVSGEQSSVLISVLTQPPFTQRFKVQGSKSLHSSSVVHSGGQSPRQIRTLANPSTVSIEIASTERSLLFSKLEIVNVDPAVNFALSSESE